MKVLILASGYGTRLGDLTAQTPKPLLKIAGKPVLEHIITRLHNFGIREIIVSVHYLAPLITEELGTYGLFFYEPRLLSHHEKLFSLRSWLEDDDFMVINGDTLSELNYAEMIQVHKSNTITAFMDEWRCAGTWIYSPAYFQDQGIAVIPYRPNAMWFDIGNPQRFKIAQEYYEKQER